MTAFAAYTIIGLGLGGIFSLAALGIVLIYRTTGVLNFAHGAMGMFSTFVAWQVFYGWSHPFWPTWLATLLAVIAGLVFAAVMGLVLELAVFRWVRTREPVVKAVITIGVLLALQSAASLIWKNNQYHLPIYLAPQTATIQIADVPVGANYVVIIVVALGLAFGLGAFLKYTSFGRSMRAVSDSPTSASLWVQNSAADPPVYTPSTPASMRWSSCSPSSPQRRPSSSPTGRSTATVVSTLVVATRLPGVISMRETRPSIGERTLVNSRFRRAASSAASAAPRSSLLLAAAVSSWS